MDGDNMANPEHLATVKRGVEAWNDWRKQNPEIKPDLRRADLREAGLRGAHLDGADLQRANLRYGQLSRCDLTGAKLTGAKLYATARDDWGIRGTDPSLGQS